MAGMGEARRTRSSARKTLCATLLNRPVLPAPPTCPPACGRCQVESRRRNGDSPVPHRLLPPLQLRRLVHLEAIYAWPVPFRLQRDARRADPFAETLRARNIRHLLPRAAPAALTVRRAGAGPSRPVHRRPRLRRNESGVDEKQQVRERRAEVRAVDG